MSDELLKEIVNKLDKFQNKVNERFESLEIGQTEIKDKQQEIKEKINIVFEHTGQLKEFRTETNNKLDKIEHDISELEGETKTLETITKENLFDIAKLKSTK